MVVPVVAAWAIIVESRVDTYSLTASPHVDCGCVSITALNETSMRQLLVLCYWWPTRGRWCRCILKNNILLKLNVWNTTTNRYRIRYMKWSQENNNLQRYTLLFKWRFISCLLVYFCKFQECIWYVKRYVQLPFTFTMATSDWTVQASVSVEQT